MKKIFIFALALFTMTGVTHAQTSLMYVNMADGITDEYRTPSIESVSFDVEEWEEYGVGTYTYHIYWSNTYGQPIEDVGLKVYHCKSQPTKYKIEDWGEGTNFYFTYDEETGIVAPEEQNTRVLESSVGEYVWVDDLVHQWGEYDQSRYLYGKENAKGYKDGDTFYFSLIYCCNSGYWGYTGDMYGDTYETLEMTSYDNGESTEEFETYVMEIDCQDGFVARYDAEYVESITYSVDPWEEIGTGTYIFADLYWSGTLEDVAVYQNSDDPSQWKCDFKKEGYPFCFTYNEETGEVTVHNQNTGYTDTYYKQDVWVDEMDDYYGGGFGANSYYNEEEDTFYFCVVYYISSGWFGYTYNPDYWEKLQMTNHSYAPAKKVKNKNIAEQGLVEVEDHQMTQYKN